MEGVKSASEADSGYLSLKVLVTQTGGQILGPDNDVSGQIDRCIADADAFYRISFESPHAGQADQYHELNVAVDKPGLTVRTNTGYYGQPSWAITVCDYSGELDSADWFSLDLNRTTVSIFYGQGLLK